MIELKDVPDDGLAENILFDPDAPRNVLTTDPDGAYFQFGRLNDRRGQIVVVGPMAGGLEAYRLALCERHPGDWQIESAAFMDNLNPSKNAETFRRGFLGIVLERP